MDQISRSVATTNSSSSPATATATATTSETADNSNSANLAGNNRSNYMPNSFRTLNKSSYKISKPIPKNPNPNPNPNLIRPSPPPSLPQQQQQQSQPPVYNIDKNDFRDVVQKLTGSPAHTSNRPPPPPPQAASPPPLSRLHRIRPPPLEQLPPHHPSPVPVFGSAQLSPLPPFPAVSAAAESPISAYMRRFHSGQLLAPSPPTAVQAQVFPLSPLSFGCSPSSQTAAASYQVMLSPSLLFPTSPRMPIPSPK